MREEQKDLHVEVKSVSIIRSQSINHSVAFLKLRNTSSTEDFHLAVFTSATSHVNFI